MADYFTNKIEMPPNGIFIGSGVYGHKGDILCGGRCFSYWVAPDAPKHDVIVKLCVEENQGNMLQFWAKGEDLWNLMQQAKAEGLYSVAFYADADEATSKKFKELGASYLGYDFGERFSMGLYSGSTSVDSDMTPEQAQKADLQTAADIFIKKVKDWVDFRHSGDWGLVMATSANFYIDYEIAAGVEVPCTEDFPFGNLTTASALNRGLFRSFNLPIWGSHLAHEWYSYLPHKNPHKMETLKTAMYLKYMTGAKMIINESGNWALQSSLCEDSPMQTMPRATDKLSEKVPDEARAQLVKDAEKLFVNIGHRSPVAVEYRKIISDFYDYTKANPAPAGQPEATIGIAKGNLDLSSGAPAYNGAIAAAYNIAKFNPNWVPGAPEEGFKILENVLFPKPKMFLPHKNLHFGATPYGQADVVSFVNDNVTADFLINNYRVLIFAGWNTCSEKQYKVLTEYVKAGGKLCIAMPHLSTDKTRRHDSFELEDLVNGGDFSELCGLKVKGKGSRFYWATGPSRKINDMGLMLARRLGIIAAPLGELEYTNPSDCYEMLAVDDENMRPVIVRCKSGKGEVYFVNTWCYPGALNLNNGAGSFDDDRGLMDYLFEYAAMQGRGHVWITGDDFEKPDADCKWIIFSYFPDAGKVCFLNLDYDNPHKCVLHYFGDKKFITLQPGEFMQIEAPVLYPYEKYNQR
ncbi:MAG: hypothetical protein MST10_06320 [Lentisphaeria bacterium]|nr:hypothetical protein [Lentisphaeria bacterium]